MTAVLEGQSVLDADPDVEAARRAAARAILGVSGTPEAAPLRPMLREHGLTAYPLVALGLLGVVDTFQGFAFSVLAPEISRALGLSFGAIAAARTLEFVATFIAPMPMAALAQKPGRRATLCLATALVWSLVTVFTGFVTSLLALVAVLVLDGLSAGSVHSLHAPLLMDSYPPGARVRVLSAYSAIVKSSSILSPLLVALLAGPLNLSWRGVFLALGLASTATTLLAIRLKDPGVGRFDTEALRAAEHAAVTGERVDALAAEDVELGFFEILRRVLLIPTLKRLAVGYFVYGMLLIPLATFLSLFLEQRWGLGPGGRGVFFSAMGVVTAAALALFGNRAEPVFREDPAKILTFAGVAMMGAVSLFALGALAPLFVAMCVLFAIGYSLLTVIGPGLAVAILSIIEARHRPHVSGVIGMFLASGSIVGVVLLAGIDRRFGISGAIVALAVPGAAAGLLVRSARTLIGKDLDRMIDEVLEGEDVRVIKQRGGHLPVLSCRGVDFSYGQLQVLYDVNFTVDDGEMVALLGTNGAGKSTLLKVISGIGLPSRGTVRYRGEDITYLDAERRVSLGIAQVPGGRAVFGTLDVAENLRLFGYTLGRNRKLIDESIEMCFEAFPRLKERRTALASTLSGGEQQMLGLSKALILQPRTLLIDELSLGLAPVVVGQLLEMVRRINDTGTAVVLVEQSVNVALSLVDHAYFMEKGEMRFDGPARQLLARDDLLRAVFLEGASKAAR